MPGSGAARVWICVDGQTQVIAEPRFACCPRLLSASWLTVCPHPAWCQPCVPSGLTLNRLPLPVQTSVFTPAYGSMTNVRVNSTMTTLQVLTLLLNKFRVSLAVGSLAPDAGGLQFCWGGGWQKPWLLVEG